MALFNRVYKLVIGKVGTNGGISIEELRIQFFIQKTLSRNPNKNTVTVWNLSPKTRSELEAPNVRCILYAGYEESAGPLLVFQGNVTFTYTYFDGPNVITEFELGDGEEEYRNGVVSLSYVENTENKTIIADIAKKIGLPLYIANDILAYRYPYGFSYYGAARNALTKICVASGLQWSIQNGLLQIIQIGGSTNRQAIVLAADSGLIGNPERQRQSASEVARVKDLATNREKDITSAARQYDGWRVKSLLMPTVAPGDQVKLESRSVSNVFIVSEVQHKGDNFEGDWQTQFKLVDNTTAAKIRQDEAKRLLNEKKKAST